MKTIENKVTTIRKSGEEMTTYADLLLAATNNPPAGGFTPEVMEKRLRIVRACKSATDKIELEDADAAAAKDAVNHCSWTMLHEDIEEFTQAVRAAF